MRNLFFSISSYRKTEGIISKPENGGGVKTPAIFTLSSMVGILGLNLLLEDWLKSIQWAEKIYEDFYLVSEENEIDILFNISLAYNNAASSYYNCLLYTSPSPRD